MEQGGTGEEFNKRESSEGRCLGRGRTGVVNEGGGG